MGRNEQCGSVSMRVVDRESWPRLLLILFIVVIIISVCMHLCVSVCVNVSVRLCLCACVFLCMCVCNTMYVWRSEGNSEDSKCG